MAKQATINKRVPILFLCEGDSERSYGKFLRDLADNSGRNYHIDSQLCGNTGGGDLLSLVKDAEKNCVLTRGKRKYISIGSYC